MDLECDDTDNDDSILFDNDTSSNDSEHGKKHKMIITFIEQFKQIKISFNNENLQLNDIIKYNILSKICRRCIFSQLESIIDIFDLHSIDNQKIVINFINEQIEQQQDIIF